MHSAPKAAVVQSAKTPAAEVGPFAIRVSAIAPGWIRTPVTDRHDADADAQAHTEARMSRLPPLRRAGEPEDVARTALHPVSDASALHHGPDPPAPWRRRDALAAPSAAPKPTSRTATHHPSRDSPHPSPATRPSTPREPGSRGLSTALELAPPLSAPSSHPLPPPGTPPPPRREGSRGPRPGHAVHGQQTQPPATGRDGPFEHPGVRREG